MFDKRYIFLFASCELMLLAQIDIANTSSSTFMKFNNLFVNVCSLVFAFKDYSVISFDTVFALLWGRAQSALQSEKI